MTTISEAPGPWPGQLGRHVEHEGRYYVISALLNAFDSGEPETMAFRSDAKGEVTDFRHIVCVRCHDLDVCQEALLRAIGADLAT